MPTYANNLILPIIAALISVIGQIFMKYAMLKVGRLQLSVELINKALHQPSFLFAVAFYVLAMLIWMQVLATTPLNIAYSVLAVTYVMVPVLSYLVFGERMSWGQVAGIAFILVGVSLIGIAQPSAEQQLK